MLRFFLRLFKRKRVPKKEERKTAKKRRGKRRRVSKILRSKGKVEEKISTKVDEMYRILEEEGTKSFSELARRLKVPVSLVEEWAKALEEHGLVEISYSVFGRAYVSVARKKETTSF